MIHIRGMDSDSARHWMDDLAPDLKKEPPASESEIEAAQRAMGVTFPDDYIDVLRWANGWQGSLGSEGYLQIWDLSWVVELRRLTLLQPYPESVPGLIYIAGDGGGEVYGFMIRDGVLGYWQTQVDAFLDEVLVRRGGSFNEFMRDLIEVPFR